MLGFGAKRKRAKLANIELEIKLLERCRDDLRQLRLDHGTVMLEILQRLVKAKHKRYKLKQEVV